MRFSSGTPGAYPRALATGRGDTDDRAEVLQRTGLGRESARELRRLDDGRRACGTRPRGRMARSYGYSTTNAPSIAVAPFDDIRHKLLPTQPTHVRANATAAARPLLQE